MKNWKIPSIVVLAVAAVLGAGPARAQGYLCEEQFKLDDVTPASEPLESKADPLQTRLLRYASLAARYRLSGLASYYSTSLDGTLTANGEIYRNRRLSAAHLTLPLGSWVEIRSLATGKRIRLRVNDRGPYVNKFVIDLSQAAAHALGVDISDDRRVDIRIIALPGEEPLPQDILEGPVSTVLEESP